MNIETTLAIYAYGTSEGVTKAWDTRGRGNNSPVISKASFGNGNVGEKGLAVSVPGATQELANRLNQKIGARSVVTDGRTIKFDFEPHESMDRKETLLKQALHRNGIARYDEAFSSSRPSSDDLEELFGIDAPKNKMTAACHGANCGRKGRKAGAKPLRSYLTKQERDSLNSKALKVKSRKKARKRY